MDDFKLFTFTKDFQVFYEGGSAFITCQAMCVVFKDTSQGVLNVYKTGAVKWRENTVNSSDNFVFQIKTNLNKYVKRCFLRLYMSKEHVGLSIGWIKYFWREIKKFFLHGDVRALRGWTSRIITWIQHAFLNRSLKTPKTKKLIL